MARQQTPGGVERSRLRSTAAALTSLTALAAMSLVAGPAVADSGAGPCALTRTAAHHSLGLDTWNGAYPKPERTLDAVMVFLSFPDHRSTLRTEEIVGDYFPATSDFFEQASYGRFRLAPHPQKQWIQMPKPSTAYGIKRDWAAGDRASYLRDAVTTADAQVDFRKYDVVYFVADPDAPGVDSDATKVVNFEHPIVADGTELRRIVTVFERHPPDRNVLAHETGHVFDLPDLYHRPTDGKGDWDTYVGDWDVMGSQFGMAPDLFAWHKWKLGWLDPSQVDCVQTGSSMHTLQPLAQAPPSGGTGGTRLAVIRTGPGSAIAVEARGSAGNDGDTCTEGVLVYRVRNEASSGGGPIEVLDAHPSTEACWDRSVYPPLADAPLEVGETYTVPGERITIEVADRTRSGAYTVKITT
ncbi:MULTISPECIES: M6 family metalloprotease domain-containing protein [Streptomyces]|uniref:M6 family metalloprotease domain-containing protein n=1 Tax=Streptomyces virginiae TaxID=1961 RepID=A0ABZ1TGU2_STRVG|nr:M6 family metalloprotease domain-containing protein [Streptomyces virginiae]WTB24553.1 M6 family metalloprotease domain-containing protein [Streptomyces virginiae]